MKKSRLLIFLGVFLLIIIAIFFYRKCSTSSIPISSPTRERRDFEDDTKVKGAPNYSSQATPNQATLKLHDEYIFDMVAFELSKKICKQEREELWELFKSPTKLPEDGQVPEGGILLEESKIILEPSQALALLKKVSNSKCSSLRKRNAEKLLHLHLDENNYRDFWDAFNLMLAEYGLSSDKLIKKSLIALDNASPDEAQALRDAILQSLKMAINDSSDLVHLAGIVYLLKPLQEHDLIVGIENHQIDALQQEFNEAFKEQMARSKQIIQKYLPPDSKVRMAQSEKDMIDSYGYEGTRAELENQRKNYEIVRGLAKKLNDLIK